MGAACLHPTWCLRNTLLTLQVWEESPKFLWAGQLFVCLGRVQAMPGSQVGPVPGTAAVRVHCRHQHCSRDTGDWRQTGERSLLPAINTERDGSI